MKELNQYSEKADALLWEKMIGGDKVAFEQLYRRYYSPLISYALSLSFDEGFAKDCIQDLFIKIFLSKRLKPIIYVRAYLYRALRNSLLDRLSLVSDFQVIDDVVSDKCLVEDEDLIRLFSEEDESLKQSKLLVNALNYLSDNQKNAIYLYYIKEFSWDEMAAALDINPHSCMNLVARSIVKLRKLVDLLKKK